MTLLVIASLARCTYSPFQHINVLIVNEYFKLICDNDPVNETRVTILKLVTFIMNHKMCIRINYFHYESQNVYTY